MNEANHHKHTTHTIADRGVCRIADIMQYGTDAVRTQ